MSAHWDLVVLGGGTAGIVGAKNAAGFGAKVLLIEEDRTGGDCLWTGCVPSKSLLAAAHAAAVSRTSAALGVTYAPPEIDFAAVMEHVRSAITTIEPVDSPQALNDAGVEVLAGRGVLTGPRSVQVTTDASHTDKAGEGGPDGVPVVHDIEFEHLLLSTGAEPAIPPIPGLAESDPLTSETVWELTALPQRLAVLGGGSIGSELGQAVARLGSQVTIVEGESRLIPREDERASAVLTAAMQADGVTVRTGAKVTEVSQGPEGRALVLDDDSSVDFDRVLVAVGRRPRTSDIGLDEAGVEVDDHGMVVVNDLLRTTNERIFSAGDLTGHAQFTHLAGMHGSAAASNAVLGTRRKAATTVPRVTFTDPEVAAVGASTQDPEAGHRVEVIEHSDIDRAVAEGRTEGFTAIVHDKGGTILGATVVGPRAGEMLSELTLAVTKGLKTTDLAGVIHPYPTYSDGPWNAALADVSRRLDSAVASRAIGALVASRRKWLSIRN
ncbi:MAG: FAD-dependent oxidoreductase [Ornithinimicrobium sp.]